MSHGTQRRRELTAYHEAGHAVAYVRLSLPFTSATIVPDAQGGSAGGARGAPFHPVGSGLKTLDRLEKEIIVALAGPLAQRRHTGRNDHVGAVKDWRRAAEFAFRRFGERPEPGQPRGDLEDVVAAYLRYLELQTERAVASPSWWSAIEVVAAALLERGTLSGRQVRGILREAEWRKLAPAADVTGP